MKCAYCGKEKTLLYRCGHCGSYFCTDHRLPKNHNCPWVRVQRKVRLSNGRIVKFDKRRITRTISNKVKTRAKAKELSNVAVNILNEKYPERILELKDIRNVVNGVLNKYHKKRKQWKMRKRRRKRRHKKRHKRTRSIKDILSWAFASVICLGIFLGGILVLGNAIGLFSLYEIETNPYGAYFFGFLLTLIGGGGIIGLSKSRRGRTIFLTTSILTCLFIGILFPNIINIFFQHGGKIENRENIENIENKENTGELVWGFGFTYVVGADGHPIRLYDNSEASNPTSENLLTFLAQDETNQIPYDSNKFVCADYAEMLHNNAENAGIRAAYVVLEFSSPYHGSNKHSLNAFKTVDNGLMFIDMSSEYDCIAYVKENKPYQLVPLFSDIKFPPIRIVARYKVQW